MSAASDWSREAINALIQAYKDQPLLYNTKMTRKSLTQQTWKEPSSYNLSILQPCIITRMPARLR